jgi:glycosyltransferase involved in cell wall biosynthesis
MIVESAGGGTGRHVLDLSDGLIARGCDVHLLYSTGRIDQIFKDRLAEIPGLRSTPLPMRTSIHASDFSVIRSVRRYLHNFGPFDAIHGHSSKGGAIARLGAVFTGVPAFYTIHGLIMMDPQLARFKRSFYLAIERVLSLTTARIIAVSPEERRAAAKLKLGESRLVLVPNGIGKLKLAPREIARQAMNVPENAIVIGFVGRLVIQKAPEVLLRAFAQAAAAAPGAHLAMIGSGPLQNQLRALSQSLAIAQKVRWLGERDARELLAGFDIFALASRKEGLPYVILEAMAAGLPVVATSSAGVESLIKPGENGYVVPPDDPAAFASALLSLLSDPAKILSAGLASLERVARFSIDSMVDKTLRAYHAGMKPRPDPDWDELEEEPAREIA